MKNRYEMNHIFSGAGSPVQEACVQDTTSGVEEHPR